MRDSVHLHGAEDVRSAANTMRAAAEDMRSAANTFAEAIDRQRAMLDEWLQRLEVIMEPSIAAPEVRQSRPGDGPNVAHDARCQYPVMGCTCRAWESSPLG